MKRCGTTWWCWPLLVVWVCSAVASDGQWKLARPGVMVDTSTETQWTQSDNLVDIDRNDARVHCSGLALDGGGWRLPTMDELSQLYSGARNNKMPCGTWRGRDLTCRAPEGFHLTGPIFWSNEQGNNSWEGWLLDLGDGARGSGPVSDSELTRALCVRRDS